MSDHTKKSLGSRVLIWGSLILLASWVITIVIIQEDRHLEISRAVKTTRNLSSVLEKHISGILLQIESSLFSLRRNWQSTVNNGEMHALLDHFVVSRANLFNLISVINADGNVVVTNQDEFKPTFSGDRSFFSYHKDNDNSKMLIGGPILGRVTGKWYLPVSIRLNDDQGNFAGVILASINPNYFSLIFQKVDLGKDSLILLIDHKGAIYSGIQGGKELGLDIEISADKVAEIFSQTSPDLEKGKSLPDEVERIRSRSILGDRQLAISVEIGYANWLEQSRSRAIYLMLLQILLSAFVLRMMFQLHRSIESTETANRELDRFFSSALDLLCIADTEGKFVRVNREWENTLGYRAEDLEQHAFLDFVHPDDLQPTQDCMTRLANQNTILNFSNRYRCKDGSYRWIEWRSSAHGNLIYAAARDITERKLTEEALKASEMRFQSFMNLSPVYAYIKNSSLKHIYSNQMAKDLLNSKGAVGKIHSSREIFDADTARLIEEADKKIFAGLENRIELEYCTQIYNTTRWLKDIKFRLELPDGSPALGGLALDITDQKRAEEERIKLQKLESIGTLAGGIAHDFNNLLMALFGNLSLARMRLDKDHPATAPLIEAEKAMDRSIRLTRQLLTFARGGDPVRQITNIGELVKETIKFDLSGRNVQPVFEIQQDLWAADIDRGQIQQVFSNLVLNSVQAMTNGGKIFVMLENAVVRSAEKGSLKAGNYIKITFRDDGPGILPEHTGRVFDPYFTTKKTGSGLGLATTHSIINRHEGHIGLESKPDQGTTFTIFLPAAATRSTSDDISARQNEYGPPLPTRILVLDDENAIRMVLTELLQRLGYSVMTVADGTEAIRAYQKAITDQNPFGIVIMDLTIPGGMGGEDAVKEILKIDPLARCVVSSGYSTDPIMANFAEYGFKGIVEKPYSTTKLQELLYRVLHS